MCKHTYIYKRIVQRGNNIHKHTEHDRHVSLAKTIIIKKVNSWHFMLTVTCMTNITYEHHIHIVLHISQNMVLPLRHFLVSII